ncbi:hypothetical protein ACO02O_00295 [Dirofilaria immitis]
MTISSPAKRKKLITDGKKSTYINAKAVLKKDSTSHGCSKVKLKKDSTSHGCFERSYRSLYRGSMLQLYIM